MLAAAPTARRAQRAASGQTSKRARRTAQNAWRRPSMNDCKRADSSWVSRRIPWIKLKCTQRRFSRGAEPIRRDRARSSSRSCRHPRRRRQAALRRRFAAASTIRRSRVKQSLVPCRPRKPVGDSRATFGPLGRPSSSRGVVREWTPDAAPPSFFHGLRDDKDARRRREQRWRRRRSAEPPISEPAVRRCTEARVKEGSSKEIGRKKATRKTPRQPPSAKADSAGASARPPQGRRRHRRRHPLSTRPRHRHLDRHHQDRRRQLLSRRRAADRAAPREATGLARPCTRRPRGPRCLSAPRRRIAHPRAARARPVVLARPRADDRGRLVHRADRRGAGQRDRVPHLDATSKDPLRPDRIVFDLDPVKASVAAMQKALMSSLLDQMGLARFSRRSGAMACPSSSTTQEDWDTVKALQAHRRHMAEHSRALVARAAENRSSGLRRHLRKLQRDDGVRLVGSARPAGRRVTSLG